MRTISRCPCATRLLISPSTASALRLRVAPRTSGITQNAHENEQPSWILTKARTRSSLASAWTQPIAPTSPATVSTACSIWPGTTVTFGGSPANAVSESRAPHPVTYTRACVRAAREAAWRDFARPSFVTQQVFTTATSPRPSTSRCPSRTSRSRSACASVCETLQPRNLTEKLATRREITDARGGPPAQPPSWTRRSTRYPSSSGLSETR